MSDILDLGFIYLKSSFLYFLVDIINGVTGMAQILEGLLNSGVLVPAIWLSLGFATAWFLLSAKRVVPLSAKEAETLWKVHKQHKNCRAKKWNEITNGQKLIGFECECGHKQVQRKPIINVKG